MSARRVWLTPMENPLPPPEDVNFVVPINRDDLRKLHPGDSVRLRDTREKQRKLRIDAESEGSFLAEVEQPTYLTEGAMLAFYRKGELIGEAQVGPLPEVVLPIKLFPGDTLILTRTSDPGADAVRDEEDNVIEPAHIHCTLAEAFEHVRPGESVWFDDGKIGGIVQANDGEQIRVEITQTGPNGGRLRAEKGITFPDTNLEIPALTEKDQVDLRHVVEHVDMVALSFLLYVRPRTWSCWVETVAFLREVLRRMDTRQYKHKAMLRKLRVFQL